MSLYITVKGQAITGYGKNGDILIKTWPLKDGQPARKKECYWNGSTVQLKTEGMLLIEHRESRLAEVNDIVTTKWPLSSKNIAAVDSQFKNLVVDSINWTTIEEVDTEIENFYTWLDI